MFYTFDIQQSASARFVYTYVRVCVCVYICIYIYIYTHTALLVGRSRDRVTVDFFRGSPQRNHVPWGRLSPGKWVPRISLGVKAAGAYGWQPTTLVVPNVKKIRGLNLPGIPWATSACSGMTFTSLSLSLSIYIYIYIYIHIHIRNSDWSSSRYEDEEDFPK